MAHTCCVDTPPWNLVLSNGPGRRFWGQKSENPMVVDEFRLFRCQSTRPRPKNSRSNWSPSPILVSIAPLAHMKTHLTDRCTLAAVAFIPKFCTPTRLFFPSFLALFRFRGKKKKKWILFSIAEKIYGLFGAELELGLNWRYFAEIFLKTFRWGKNSSGIDLFWTQNWGFLPNKSLICFFYWVLR